MVCTRVAAMQLHHVVTAIATSQPSSIVCACYRQHLWSRTVLPKLRDRIVTCSSNDVSNYTEPAKVKHAICESASS